MTAHAAHHELVSLREAAERFHVSIKTLRRRIADGTITGYRIGRLVRVDLDDVEHELLVEIPSARGV
ncbi:DNA binding domain protein, excisionase family [Xylanimonas cellulosilytica DSM 15894]|uniref:DNA binding domain protein, excisionase family n=1 Tax=Xylanimonas cellulosilytica (strain DSM 15894 / JCM 12276 / CECT 5975 / KCTC 9989 / LMG 20990 / NBRC 107835 / XIL07) TaxID=446471 RepID=D1BVP7_XYLCX|nr:helix-turn-helix domain-containing protein [Xylanimonas cellulosilytica]ACZ31366.1 DNA binding domain protein, excisionase family [Xylanimonas cellulosilytica DSM 15894]